LKVDDVGAERMCSGRNVKKLHSLKQYLTVTRPTSHN